MWEVLIPVAERSKTRVCVHSLARVKGLYLVSSSTGLCDRPIPHPEAALAYIELLCYIKRKLDVVVIFVI